MQNYEDKMARIQKFRPIDGTDMARLMKCFMQEEVDDPKFPKTSKRVHMLKHSEGGLKIMCAVMEEYAEERIKDADRKTARHFFQNGASLSLVIASIRSLSEKELREIYEAVIKESLL